MTEDDDIPLEPWAHGMEMRDVVFVREFLIDMKVMPAALRANYYATEGTARANSWKLMRRPAILRAVALAMEDRAKAVQVSAKLVLSEAWRCYLECLSERNWLQARGFLELAGRHVDVRAFRDKSARGSATDDQDDEADEAGLANLTFEELETLGRLSRKAAGLPETEGPPSTLRH